MILSPEAKFDEVVEIMKPFKLSNDDYNEFCDIMYNTFKLGLKKASRHKSSIKMFPSYVTKIPNGKESGNFLALDLGGTNYRVLAVTLEGKDIHPKIDESTYSIPSKKMTGSGKELFDYIAETLLNFMESRGLNNKHYKLGFTFSFPCEQAGLTKAILVRWTKGFAANGVENENVATFLQNAMNEKGLDVECVAVVNDTVGTLASCALNDPKCAIGLIAGTGTNAAYIECCDNVEMMEKSNAKEVVINTEWGAFGELGEINKWITTYDKILDQESLHPGKQIFEKMVSGMYLGELVRVILVDLVKRKLLFRGALPESLRTKDKLLTKFLSDVERDPPNIYCSTDYMLTQDLRVPVTETIDNKIVRYVCELVGQRAAYLVGSAVASLLRKIERTEVTVGVDGSLYKFHPKFPERMVYMIDQLRPKYTRFYMRLSEDGSGKGAAAIAAATVRA